MEGLSLELAKAQTTERIPEFWIDVLQVPLEAPALQVLPQVQSALNTGGEGGGQTQRQNTAVSEMRTSNMDPGGTSPPGWEAYSTNRAHALHPRLPGGCWRK